MLPMDDEPAERRSLPTFKGGQPRQIVWRSDRSAFQTILLLNEIMPTSANCCVLGHSHLKRIPTSGGAWLEKRQLGIMGPHG